MRIGGQESVDPQSVEVRRGRRLEVLWLKNSEGTAGCQLVYYDTDGALITLDAIPLALGLAVDGIAGTWPSSRMLVGPLELDSAAPDPASMYDEEQIKNAFRQGRVNLCEPGVRRRFYHAGQIQIFTGGFSPDRRYRRLGPVSATYMGSDVTSGSQIGPIGFAQRTVDTAAPTAMDALLRLAAYDSYGREADAIVNVSYYALPGGSIEAKGIAVKLSDVATDQVSGDVERRLHELEELRRKELISPEEYGAKRREILGEL